MSSPTAPEPVLGCLLAVQSPPLLPEIRLWLVDGRVDLNTRCPELLAGGHAPYWAFCWGAGQALARHVLDHPALVRGRRVVDFGAGSGVVAIAAARAGAASVVAVDTDARARGAALRNAELNGVRVSAAAAVPDAFEVLLASDVLYEPGVLARLRGYAAAGRQVWLSDPERDGAVDRELTPFGRLHAQTFPDVDAPVRSAALYRLDAPAPPAALTPSGGNAGQGPEVGSHRKIG